MLTIVIPSSEGDEFWDEAKEEFVYTNPHKEYKLTLEHSLVSLQKWESKWHKPFLSKGEKSFEQVIDYIKSMTITQNVPDEVYGYLTDENIKEITDYIEDPMTATVIKNSSKKSSQFVSAELIYTWMIQLTIPSEYRKWHLNQLMTLIRVCSEENKEPKKLSQAELAQRYAEINKRNREKYNTKG